MRTFTAHLHPRKAPVLVPEGFSWGALFFGPLWLLRHGAWLAAVLALAALALGTLVPPALRPAATFGVLLMLGVLGNDIRRWALGLRRFQVAHVVAARTRDEAMLRLLSHRPDVRGFLV